MHAWLAFLAGILFAVGIFLIVSAGLGITYYGLAGPIEILIASILIVFGVIVSWLLYFGVKAQHKKIKTGEEALIGAKGVVTTTLAPNGEIRILGEFWQATSKEGTISVGQDVEVIDMKGMFLIVKPVEQKA